MLYVSTTITVASSLTTDVVFDVGVSLPLFIFVLSRVLLWFCFFILSYISFDGFRQVISPVYFGRRGPHFFHSSTAFIGFRGVGCNNSKSCSVFLIDITLSAGFKFFPLLFLDICSRLYLYTVDYFSSWFVNVVGCETLFNPDIQSTWLLLKFPFSGTI